MYKPKHTKTKKQSHLDCLWMICYAKELYSFLIIFNFNNFFHLFLQTASTTDSGTSVFSAIHEAPSIFFSSLHRYAQVVWDSCLSIRLFSRYVLPNGTSMFFWWEHSYRIHIVFREEGKPPCTLSDTRDLDLRGAGQIMHDYPTVPTRHVLQIYLPQGACLQGLCQLSENLHYTGSECNLSGTACSLLRVFFYIHSELFQECTQQHFSGIPCEFLSHSMPCDTSMKSCNLLPKLMKIIRNWGRWDFQCNSEIPVSLLELMCRTSVTNLSCESTILSWN